MYKEFHTQSAYTIQQFRTSASQGFICFCCGRTNPVLAVSLCGTSFWPLHANILQHCTMIPPIRTPYHDLQTAYSSQCSYSSQGEIPFRQCRTDNGWLLSKSEEGRVSQGEWDTSLKELKIVEFNTIWIYRNLTQSTPHFPNPRMASRHSAAPQCIRSITKNKLCILRYSKTDRVFVAQEGNARQAATTMA